MRGGSQARRASNLAVRIEDTLGNPQPPVEKSVNFTLDDVKKDLKDQKVIYEKGLAEDSLFHSDKSMSPKNSYTLASASKGQKNAQFSFGVENQNEKVVQSAKKRVPKNFKAIAKMSFERQGTLKRELEDTLDSFFDKKKLYLKSVVDHQNKTKNAQFKMRTSANSPTGFNDFDAIEQMNLDQVINRQEF